MWDWQWLAACRGAEATGWVTDAHKIAPTPRPSILPDHRGQGTMPREAGGAPKMCGRIREDRGAEGNGRLDFWEMPDGEIAPAPRAGTTPSP